MPADNRWTFALAALLAVGPACSQATSPVNPTGRSVLFVGNSLTYSNDLPAMVERVAEAAGDSVRVGMVAGPNMAVIDHTPAGSEARTAIEDGDWAFVVLQQGPTPPGICRDTLVIAAMRLAPAVRARGGRTVVFMPWARRTAPQSLGFISETATAAARAVGGVVAPVGIAWREALSADPELPLYEVDGYHPAPVGTLLAALTIYERLFRGDVRAIPPAALAGVTAVQLSPGRLEALAAAAHAAASSLPPDPSTPLPPDTTRLSPGGGPC